MNITELARRLKITPQELRENLPRMGFHIGPKAIKINNKSAQQILKEWPKFREKLKQEQEQTEKETKPETIEKHKTINISNFITVRDFANMSQVPVNKILSELMKNGVFASINEKIDFDTASIVGDELGIDVKLKKEEEEEEEKKEDQANKIEEVIKKEKNLVTRPPVIVVMGHVDHGKTKLLDTIRKTNTVEEESGGITQHIGAYQAVRNDRILTFIDTPGHEAFTAMRSRGAKIADIAILIVAADDGVKPQTVEAYRIIEAAKIPYVIAINKIDKPEADINKTKQEITNKLGAIPEDWGGKITCAPVSAMDGKGVQELLDMLLLTADTEAYDMKANPDTKAIGTIIESHVDKAAGPEATILVQNGTLRVGDQLCLRGRIVGKVKSLKNYTGEDVEEATPSMPAKILGLKTPPVVGDVLEVGEGERIKGKMDKLNKKRPAEDYTSAETGDEEIKKFNLIIKSDFLGSAEAVEESLEKINTEEVKNKIIHKGLGNITEGDVNKAETANAQIIGFNVKVPTQVETLARERGVEIKNFSIIYDLIEYVKQEMQKLVTPNIERIDQGKLKVLAVFRTEKNSQIIGGKVLEGKIKNNSLTEVLRNKEVIAKGKVSNLKIGKEKVNIVEENQECGIQFDGEPVIDKGDILQFYEEKEVYSKL